MKRILLILFCVAMILPSQIISLYAQDFKAQKKELAVLRSRVKLPKPKASQKELETASNIMMAYRTGFSKINKENITLQQMREIAKNVRILAAAAEMNGGDSMKDFNDYLDFLYVGNIIESIPKFKYSNYTDVRKVPADFLSALSVCDDERKAHLIASVRNLLEVDIMHKDAEYIRANVNSDYLYNAIPHVLLCALYDPDDRKAVEEVQAFSDFLSACTQYTDGGNDILKPDGTGFHHKSHYNGYMYSYRTWVQYMGILSGTSFRISEQAYENMKKAIISYYLMAVNSKTDKNHTFANSLAGRHPFSGMELNFSAEMFETLIAVGGDVKGKAIDEELASYYNYFFKTNKYKKVAQITPDGFYQFNYSPIGVYRKDDWVVTMRCPTRNFWGGEIYDKTNRYGRYQSHGTLEVIYEGGRSASGYPVADDAFGAGWDWNMSPGSTTVHYGNWTEMMPNGNDKDRFDQRSETTDFSGALSFGDCGMFAAEFDQGDKWGSQRFTPTLLKFCKSVYAFDGLLWSVGTDISALGEYPERWNTATNLFQQVVSDASVIVNGAEVASETHYDMTSDIRILTPVGTGFVIPAGNEPMTIFAGRQKSP
ncbi:MAG: chondroitinase family polysaccharide lyase, partial [Candidatus Cryptobacteroides sp.]